MPQAISNTSPLFYLHRIHVLDWLPRLFDEIWTPKAVILELQEGSRRGFDVPHIDDYSWLKVVNPRYIPSEWLALDLGAGELGAMSLALEHPERLILLDDGLARRTAQAAGLTVWGTLKVLLEAKSQHFTDRVEPFVGQLANAGMWITEDIRQRILALAQE